MRPFFCFLALTACLSLSPLTRAGTPKPLEIYFIDVEGGQATLIVDPRGPALLVDTGWPGFAGRDAGRIVSAAHAGPMAGETLAIVGAPSTVTATASLTASNGCTVTFPPTAAREG